MCEHIQFNFLANLQLGQNIKGQCNISSSTLFTCGPQSSNPTHDHGVWHYGPHNLTLEMYSGSSHLHNNAGGLNTLDVSCQTKPTTQTTNDIMLGNGAFVECNPLSPGCCDSLQTANALCKKQYGAQYGEGNVSARQASFGPGVFPFCEGSAQPYQCWATVPTTNSRNCS